MKALKTITVILLVVSALLGRSASAAVIYVDVDANGNDDGTSWTDAYNDLQDGLGDANSADEIWVAEGTYTPSDKTDPNDARSVTFQLVSGVGLYGGFDATETSRDQRDWVANETILTGDLDSNDVDVNDPCDLPNEATRAENCYHVVTGAGAATTIIDGFTITKGHANGEDYQDSNSWAGGMYNSSSASPTVKNCKFTDNYAWAEGGALVHRGDITVADCNFQENACKWDGGAVFSGSHGPSVQGGTFTNCTFTDNFAWVEGGAVTIGYISTAYENCVVTDNHSESGGGAFTIGGNGASSVPPKVTNCLIANNTAENNGGAFNSIYTDLCLRNCTIVRNQAGAKGGGISNDGGSDPIVTNCIFWDNEADTSGGEIYNASGVEPNFSYCCIEGGLNGSKCAGPNSIDGGGNIDDDPCFVDADSNDFHLGPNSPCIDAGDPNGDYTGQTDIDGEDRVMDGDADCNEIVDMGADEVYGPDCWNCGTQCHGDADCSGTVDFTDLGILKQAEDTNYPDPNYNACADFDKDGDCDDDDLDILKDYVFTSPDPNCDCGGTWPPQ
jgi:hypothetical protein